MSEKEQKTKIFNIHAVVAESSCEYFDYLRDNFRWTAAHPENLFFFCYAIDEYAYGRYRNHADISLTEAVYLDNISYRKKTWADWKVFLHAKLTRRATLRGSNGHSAGLNRIMKIMPRIGGHHVIADTDVVVLQKDWDLTTANLLGKHELVGTTYPDIGGFSSGDTKAQTYKSFPNAVWLAIADRCDLSQLDWMPDKENNVPIDNQDMSRIYNLPIGYQLVRDSGWKLPAYAHGRGYRYVALKNFSPTSPSAKAIRTGNEYNEEYQLDGEPFVAHQRGGSRHAFRQADISKIFYYHVEKYLAAQGVESRSA